MKHTTRFSWKIILFSFSAFALNGCASNAPQMSLLSDQDLCYQYLYIPTNDGRYDNYVYDEVEYRTYYKGLLGCDTFARGQANNIREASVQRFANRVTFGDVLGQLGDAYGSGKPTTAPAQAAAPQSIVTQRPAYQPTTPPRIVIQPPVYQSTQPKTVKCEKGFGGSIDPQPVVEFAGVRCPLGYTKVGD